MSNEERQRILRETGGRPAQAEKEAGAAEGEEKLGRQEGEGEQPEAPDKESPLAEDDSDQPRPRR